MWLVQDFWPHEKINAKNKWSWCSTLLLLSCLSGLSPYVMIELSSEAVWEVHLLSLLMTQSLELHNHISKWTKAASLSKNSRVLQDNPVGSGHFPSWWSNKPRLVKGLYFVCCLTTSHGRAKPWSLLFGQLHNSDESQYQLICHCQKVLWKSVLHWSLVRNWRSIRDNERLSYWASVLFSHTLISAY